MHGLQNGTCETDVVVTVTDAVVANERVNVRVNVPEERLTVNVRAFVVAEERVTESVLVNVVDERVTENVRVNVVGEKVAENVRVKLVGDAVNVTVALGCRFAAFVDSLATATVAANKRTTPNADRTFGNRKSRYRWLIYPISINHM